MSRHSISTLLVTALLAGFFSIKPCVRAEAQFPFQDQHQDRHHQDGHHRQHHDHHDHGNSTTEDILRLFIQPEDPPAYHYDDDYDDRRQVVETPPPRHVPTTDEAADMTPEQQRAVLRQALQTFDDQLSDIKIGPGWKRHLQTEQLGHHLWSNRDAEPSATARIVLQEMARRYNKVASSDRYQFIRNSWGFRTINSVLPEYVMSPVDRQRRDTRGSSAMLQSALDRTRTGPGWNKFLMLADIQRIARRQGDMSEDDQALLETIVERFQKASDESKYPVFNRTRGFAATRQSVEQLLFESRQPSGAENAWARTELAHLVLDLEALKEGCQKEAEAVETWVMAPENSNDAEEAEAVVMALKNEHDKRNKEATARVMGLIENENRRHDAMGKLVLDLAAMKKELKAAETWVMAPEGSSDGIQARKTLLNILHQQQEARKTREWRVAELIATVMAPDDSSAQGSESVVMAPEDAPKAATEVEVLAPENGDNKKDEDSGDESDVAQENE